jgi:2-methylisocitrate lyase-like PEP mutase family enzyme
MSARAQLRAAAVRGRCVLTPLALDPLTARMCEELGFEAVYLSGGALGYQYAVSEALLTLSEVADVARRMTQRSSVPLVVDAGVGFGDAVHMSRTIAELEAAGAAAVEIEDQVAPKRVSHHRGVEHLVPLEEMAAKVAVAAEARSDPDLLIIARTGALRNESVESAVERSRAYLDCGADMILLMPTDEDQWRRLPELVNAPLVAFAALDQRRAGEWAESGWSMILDPFTAQVLAHETVRDAYRRLLAEGSMGVDGRAIWTGYQDLPRTAGLEELYDIERRTTEPGS